MKVRSKASEKKLFGTFSKQIHYDPFSGAFFWLAGKKYLKAGDKLLISMKKNRYLSYEFQKKQILAHRLAWFCYHGEVPNGIIDHINGDCYDNSISNLRVVDQCFNFQNRKGHRTGDLLFGAHKHQTGKYIYYAAVVKGKHYGNFKTRLEAHQRAVCVAKEKGIPLLGGDL